MSRTTTTRSVIIAGTVLGLVAAACAQEADDNPLVLAGGGSGEDIEEQQAEAPEDPTVLVPTALEEVNRYWGEAYPEAYGEEFIAIGDLADPSEQMPGLPQGPFVPYNSSTNPLPCEAPDYETVAGNAFYCQPPYDLIAWDEENLIPQLAEDFGGFAVATVMAHEFGHGVQARAAVDESTLLMEQQADCFAGAWTGWIAEGNSESFAVAEDTLDFTIAGFINFRDEPGTSGEDVMAHGSGFDRVGAFQDGYQNGATRCAEYPTDAPATTEIEFSSEDEVQTGGNMATDELLPLMEQNLNAYHGYLFETDFGESWEDVTLQVVDPASDSVDCAGETLSGDDLELASIYCEDERTVVIGSDLITEGAGDLQSLEQIGDFAVGAEIGQLYARAAQLQLGVDDESVETSLLADCMTGYWAQANFPIDGQGTTPLNQEVGDEAGLIMSAGDLDEAVMGFLTYGRAFNTDAGTAFERTAALRLGFLGSIDDCQEQYGIQLGG